MERLTTCLKPLIREKLITIGSHDTIKAGTESEKGIKELLYSAHMILLLISPDFIASDYCYDILELSLQRYEQNEALISGILLRHTTLKGAPFDRLPMLPGDGQPVSKWTDQDEAWNDVFKHLYPMVVELLLPLCIDEAKEHVENGQLAGALDVYERALKYEPHYVPALYGKGRAIFLSGHYEESLMIYEKAIEVSLKNSGNADARSYYGKARALRKLQHFEESLQAYDEAIRDNPHQISACKGKASLLLKLERYAEALAIFKHTTFGNELYAQHIRTGDLLVKLRSYWQALEAYDAAIIEYKKVLQTGELTVSLKRRKAFLQDLYHKKGQILFRFGRFEEAKETYGEAIKLNPGIALYHQNQGRALLALHSFQEALDAYETCIALTAEGDPHQFYGKAQALAGLKRYQEALVALDEAIRLSGDNPDPAFFHKKALAYKMLSQQMSEMGEQARKNWKPARGIEVPTVIIPRPEEFTLLPGISPNPYAKFYCMAMSADGEILATLNTYSSVKDDGKPIKLWELPSGLKLNAFTDLSPYAISLAISPDGKLLACGKGNTIKLRNLVTGKELHTLCGHSNEILAFAFSPDGKFLVSGSSDNTIKLWNLPAGTQQLPRTLTGHTDAVDILAINPDGQLLASGSRDGTIKLWNPLTGQELCTLVAHANPIYKRSITSLSISYNGGFLASRSDDTIKLWELHTGQEPEVLFSVSGFYSVAISPDGQILALGGVDKTIRLWKIPTGKELHVIYNDRERPWLLPAYTLLFSPDGQRLLSLNEYGGISMWGKRPV